MTTLAWIFATVFAVAAVTNWVTRWSESRSAELWSKPLALLALIGVALTLEPADPAIRVWFVVALVLSLAGDVFLLDDRRFVAGLASFLLAHLAYTVGLVLAPDWRWGLVAGALVVIIALVATAGVRIVAGARREALVLGPAVTAYLCAISTMFVVAAASGNWWAIAGAALFVASDTVLGWRQFVTSERWMSPTVMVTYHLGQAGLVVSLI